MGPRCYYTQGPIWYLGGIDYHVGDSDIIPAGTLTGYVSWDRSNVSRWKAILDHG